MEDQSNTTLAEELSLWLGFSFSQGATLGLALYCVLNFSRFLWVAGCYLGRPVGAVLVKPIINALNKDYGVGYFIEKAKNGGARTVPASAEEHEVIRKRREEAERQAAGAFSLVLCWSCILYFGFYISEAWEHPTMLEIPVTGSLVIVCLCMMKGAFTGIAALLILRGCVRIHGLS